MSNQTDLIEYITELVNNDANLADYAYEILRVHPSAEQEVIESSYRRLLRLYHPDVNKNPMADDVTKILISTYEILGDSDKRAEYDAYIASPLFDVEPEREQQERFSEEERRRAEREYSEWELEMIKEQTRIIQEMTARIELDPQFPDTYHFRAWAYYMIGEDDLASQDFAKAIELDPNFADHNKASYDVVWHLMKRAEFRVAQGEFALAIQDYTKMIELDPDSCEWYMERGDAYMQMGNFDLAIQDYSKAIEIDIETDPESIWGYLYYLRGCAYMKQGQLDLAIRDFDTAISASPDSDQRDYYRARTEAYAKISEAPPAVVDRNTAGMSQSGQRQADSAKATPTPVSGASPRTATNERTQTQPAGNSSTIWTQTQASQPVYQTSDHRFGQASSSQDGSVIGTCIAGAIFWAVVATVIVALIVIFWNDTAANVVLLIFLIIVGGGIWSNGKISIGLKCLLTLGGIACVIGCASVFYFIGWVVGFNLDKVFYIGLAAGMGVVFGVMHALITHE